MILNTFSQFQSRTVYKEQIGEFDYNDLWQQVKAQDNVLFLCHNQNFYVLMITADRHDPCTEYLVFTSINIRADILTFLDTITQLGAITTLSAGVYSAASVKHTLQFNSNPLSDLRKH